MNKNLSKKILMFSELLGGAFLTLVGAQAFFASATVNLLLAFAGLLLILTGLGHSDELDREKRLHQKNGMGPTTPPPPPRDIHPNILCGSGEDTDENNDEQKED